MAMTTWPGLVTAMALAAAGECNVMYLGRGTGCGSLAGSKVYISPFPVAKCMSSSSPFFPSCGGCLKGGMLLYIVSSSYPSLCFENPLFFLPYATTTCKQEERNRQTCIYLSNNNNK